jgi:hypothetical protein
LLRAFAIAGLAALSLVSPGTADEASGTWTGQVEVRTNYYWETSTRVVAPEARVRLVSPEGVQVDAGYLLDAITSASIAAGAQEDIRFTEVRNQGNLAVSRELDLGGAQLRLGAAGRLSHEPDWIATGLTAYGALSLFQRSTVISASATYIHDTVGSVLRSGMVRVDPETGRDLSDRGRQGTLEGLSATVSLNQVLSPVSTLVVGYQVLHNWGYLQNPYRQAPVEAVGLSQERHPTQRTRHAVYARLAYYLPVTRTAVHLMGRLYADDWSVVALTPEVRLYQEIGDQALVRLRYRYYRQDRSFFFSPEEYAATAQFISADPKMSEFDSHLFGAQVRVRLDFLGQGPLAFLEESWLDLSFNYWFQTSTFGDGVLSQVGFRTPF